MAAGQHVHLIEHLKHGASRLMDRAYDRATLVRQIVQQTNAMGSGQTVQSRRGFVQEQNRSVVEQLESD